MASRREADRSTAANGTVLPVAVPRSCSASLSSMPCRIPASASRRKTRCSMCLRSAPRSPATRAAVAVAALPRVHHGARTVSVRVIAPSHRFGVAPGVPAEALFAPAVELSDLLQHHDREKEVDRNPHAGDPQCDVRGGPVFVHRKYRTGAFMATSATAMIRESTAVRSAAVDTAPVGSSEASHPENPLSTSCASSPG